MFINKKQSLMIIYIYHLIKEYIFNICYVNFIKLEIKIRVGNLISQKYHWLLK